MKLDNLSIDSVRRVLHRNTLAFYDSGKPYDLNLIFIRSRNRTANKFDDARLWIYRNAALDWSLVVSPCTTDPGDYYLKNPMLPTGCAIQAPGQVRGAYRLGKHRGTDAFVQAADFPYYRDNNRDNMLDLDPKKLVWGGVECGLNYHCVHKGVPDVVENISAGCFDDQEPGAFAFGLWLMSEQIRRNGWTTLTRTLLDEVDFV